MRDDCATEEETSRAAKEGNASRFIREGRVISDEKPRRRPGSPAAADQSIRRNPSGRATTIGD